jgi:predicted pyridoxine 5'-phosphate oxidase superfamily flavin-nucleotide-binding protein
MRTKDAGAAATTYIASVLERASRDAASASPLAVFATVSKRHPLSCSEVGRQIADLALKLAIEIMGWGTYLLTSALGRRSNPLCGRAPAVEVEIKNRSSRSR